jgi:alpha-2-macroglobulin
MSRVLPNAVVGRAFQKLGVSDPTLQADLPPKINAGIQRLYGFQHNDGGWGWWYDDNTHDYQTAWVVFGLAMTKEAGYEVDPEVIKRGADWLKANLNSMDARTRAYALYTLAIAGYGDLKATQTLARDANKLDAFSQAALALALHELGAKDEAQRIIDLLALTAVVKDGTAYWPNALDDGHYYEKTMASTTRSTALVLSAFVHIAPDHKLEPSIVRWLMSQRRQQGWGSTNETSFAILALTDHLLAVEVATAGTTYSVNLNGQAVTQGNLGRGEPAASVTITAGQMVSGVNHLRLDQSGEGKLYYRIIQRTYLPQAEIAADGKVRVSREYLDPKTDRPIGLVQPGQLVKVRLTVTLPDNGYYIIVEDNLPGGLEALNEKLNTTSHEASAEGNPHYYWQEYGYNNKEVRGDRVDFFITEMGKGPRMFTYLARATHAGQYVAMPVEVSAMYDATVWGRSASATFVVTGGERHVASGVTGKQVIQPIGETE